MQIPILSGIYTDNNSDIRASYPVNMVPTASDSGISSGYLRPSEGIVSWCDASGIDRGGISWNGICYRAAGSKLIRINSDGSIVVIGDIGNDHKNVRFDYSFDRLSVASSGALYYWDGVTLSKVTDTDIGVVKDQVWVDGYFMTTDGQYLVVTDLNNPFSINPLKYGSSEADPDRVVALLKVHNEIHAVNSNTIEVFQNVGGTLFPFQRVPGAQIMRGCAGTFSCCVFSESVAFVGGARNEQNAVWLGASGQSVKLSTREIDLELAALSSDAVSAIVLEAKNSSGRQLLYLHLPDKTYVYDAETSNLAGASVWFILSSGVNGAETYKARNFVWCYDKWICGDPTASRFGYLTDTLASHYGDVIGWEFSTPIIYNESRGAIIHSLELVSITGRSVVGVDSTAWSSYSLDGIQWSQERARSIGKIGETTKRIDWRRNGAMANFRIQKFRGTSDAMLSVARLEAEIEPLYV